MKSSIAKVLLLATFFACGSMAYAQLSYTLRQKYVKFLGLNKISFYGSVNNPFVLTKYSGVDPDISAWGYSPAIDNAQTPRSRSYTLGITVDF